MSRLTRHGLILTIIMLLAAAPCRSESSVVDSLMKYAGNIHQFNSIFPQEKVFIQFDNTSYYTGETIWFKAFVVNASTLGRAQSKVLYVDLLSPSGVLLKQQKLKIVAGQADGSFALLDGSTAQAREKRGVLRYPSGFYEVRAYTSFMLNFDYETLFSRVLAVYDLPHEEGNYYESSPTITLKHSNATTVSELRPETEKLRNINASFYPEGGHLIIGKPCRVAFKVTDDTGLGVEATGKMESDGITFSTMHDGMGWFSFTPLERRNEVEITVNGKSRRFNLPQAESAGFAMTVEDYGTDSIRIRVDGTPDMSGMTLGLGLTCRGELMDFGTIETGSAPSERIIPMRGVPEGVCRLYLFDNNGTKFASRSLYHRSQVIRTPVLEVMSDKPSYGPFEKITLNLCLEDGKGNPFRDRFCLSVRDTRGQSNIFADDLRTSMLLSSDLKGLIENPSWYFDSNDPGRDQALDLLCLVQGWERYDWDVMTGQKNFSERHRMEESLTLNGWILNPSGNKKMKDVQVTAALVPQDKRLTETYSYTTDTTGYFGFNIGAEFYDKAKFTIGAHTGKKRLIGTPARIKIDRPTMPPARAYTPGELVFSSIRRKIVGEGQFQPEDDELPTVINVETGFLLPDVDIDEERMYIDYFTFNAYDVVKDVEIELDKGEYSTDLLGYLKDKGYDIQFGYLIEDLIRNQKPDSPLTRYDLKLLINNHYAYFYAHTENKYTDLEKDSRMMGADNDSRDDPSILAANLDTRDIKSIMIYERPMSQAQAWNLSPLYWDFMGRDKNENDYMSQNTSSEGNRLVYMIDILLKENTGYNSRSDISDISKRTTTVDGYSRPFAFYSPEYPDGPVFGDVDYRRTLYWNPNVITDEDGKAQVEFYNSSITKHFNVEAAGMTSSGIPYTLDAGF